MCVCVCVCTSCSDFLPEAEEGRKLSRSVQQPVPGRVDWQVFYKANRNLPDDGEVHRGDAACYDLHAVSEKDYGEGGWLCGVGTEKGAWFTRRSRYERPPAIFDKSKSVEFD